MLYRKGKDYYLSNILFIFIVFTVTVVLLSITIVKIYLTEHYKDYFNKRTYKSEEVILTSVNKNINYIMKEFIKTSSEISIDDNLYNMTESYKSKNAIGSSLHLLNSLSKYAQYSQWIENICIISDQGRVIQYDRKDYTNYKIWNSQNNDILIEMDNKMMDLMRSKKMPRYLIMSYNLTHPNDSSLHLFHIVVPLKGRNKWDKVTNMVVISFNMDVMREFIDTIYNSGEDISTGYITNEAGIIIFHENPSMIGLNQKDFLHQKDLENISDPISKTKWTLNIATDVNKMQLQMNEIYYRGSIFYLAIIFISTAFIAFIILIILKPVKAINYSIQKVKTGELTDRIQIEGKHEIWKLAQEYNNMLATIYEMNKQVEKTHNDKIISIKKKQRAEWEALESQINAHFICNTLGAINYEVIEMGNHKASVLIKKLSNILRYTFDQKHQQVYIQQEIAWIEQYLYLQKFRLEEVFDYEISFPEEFESWPCRKLMLQPFVENSIKHGFKNRQQGGMIYIRGEKADNKLKLIIQDNGQGMDPDTEEIIRSIIKSPLEADVKNVGIGISNVITRMRMYYGDEMEVELITGVDEGTEFIFYLPYPLKEYLNIV
jgi:Putative regulator of cell autolysis